MGVGKRSSVRVAKPDPIRLEIVHQLLAAICEEGGAVLQRSAISPNIRERRDFSFALFDGAARLIAQAAHIPVHLGSAAESVRAVQQAMDLAPGDVAIVNDPYRGGTHLPDVTLVRPVFCAGQAGPAFFLVDRAHHADIGGAVAGSMGVARDLHGEGLVIPPVKLIAGGEPVRAVHDLIAANVRHPAERMVDLRAQHAALEVAERRLLELVADRGLAALEQDCLHLCDYAERIARDVVATLPPGTHRAADQLDDDGTGAGPQRIALELTRTADGRLRFDWTDCAPEARGPVNANRGVVTAACVYALRCLCPDRLPTNDGLFRVLEIVTRPGSLLDPRPPAPVAGGNVETSQRLVDVCFAALEAARPGTMPAASAGTMSNLTLGGSGPRGPFSIYETLPGGAGATAARAGASAIQTHMTNTRNTPIEDAEATLPLRIVSLTVRRGSGGAGARRGGDGIVKQIELLAPTTVSLFADRARTAPPGCAGGAAGAVFRARVRGATGAWRALPPKGSVELAAGARLSIETPGGGGHGPA